MSPLKKKQSEREGEGERGREEEIQRERESEREKTFIDPTFGKLANLSNTGCIAHVISCFYHTGAQQW